MKDLLVDLVKILAVMLVYIIGCGAVAAIFGESVIIYVVWGLILAKLLGAIKK
jgi:hypothetical protein